MWLCLWIAILAGETQTAPVDFETQVMPILTKAGCNTGACHGAAAGRGGFSLSLYGSRPATDFAQITLALEGRRIDRMHSEMSLLLLKPTEQLSHEGGTRLELDGRDFKIVQRWIEQGARLMNSRHLREFSFISEAVDGDDSRVAGQRRVQLIATARFSDHAVHDVLPWTVLTPDDPSTGGEDVLRLAARLCQERCSAEQHGGEASAGERISHGIGASQFLQCCG
ncbi:MAG: hypothetical protein WKF77_21330 [Planctomycetaceae bacterium]